VAKWGGVGVKGQAGGEAPNKRSCVEVGEMVPQQREVREGCRRNDRCVCFSRRCGTPSMYVLLHSVVTL